MAHESCTSLLIDAIPPFPSLSISLPSSTPVSDVYGHLCRRYPSLPPNLASLLALSTHGGLIPGDDQPLSSFHADSDVSTPRFVSLRLHPRLPGGKGGFGSQLRAAGGRMSSQKTSNNDSCRDLNGRRLSTLKEAKKLADYLESEPQRIQAKAEAQRAKLEALERKLGIEHGEARKQGEVSTEVLAGKKHRFDDTEYLEQSRELVDSVKTAVSVGLLKKRKKAKTSPSPEAEKEKGKVEGRTKGKEREVAGEVKEIKKPVKTSVSEMPSTSAIPLDAVGA